MEFNFFYFFSFQYDRTAIYIAAERGFSDIVEYLVDKVKVDVNFRAKVRSISKELFLLYTFCLYCTNEEAINTRICRRNDQNIFLLMNIIVWRHASSHCCPKWSFRNRSYVIEERGATAYAEQEW
jgi:hypothetical protein